MRKGKEKTKKWSKEEWEVRSSSDPLTFFRGRPRKEVKMKQEKVKEEIKKETKGPMKKVDEVRPGAICKNCQGHMNHNRAGQVGIHGNSLFFSSRLNFCFAAGDASALLQVQFILPPNLRWSLP